MFNVKQSTKHVKESAWVLVQKEIRALNNNNIRASIGDELMRQPHKEVMKAYYPYYLKYRMIRYDALLSLGAIAETRTAKEFLKNCIGMFNEYSQQHENYFKRYLSEEE